MTKKNFNKQCHAARVRVMEMDAIDGFADRKIPTITAALGAGILTENLHHIMDAYVMLCDLCPQITKPRNQ